MKNHPLRKRYRHFRLPLRTRFSMTCLLFVLVITGGVFMSLPAASADAPLLVITQPAHQETIHSNVGEVPVVVTLQGAQVSAGRYLRVLLDGKWHGQNQRTLGFTLRHVDRG